MAQPVEPTMMLSASGVLPGGGGAEVLPTGSLVTARYRIEALLGQGGMGAVYRAYDTELEEPVALKVLHRGNLENEGLIERFRREVKLARKVTHPNVARTFDLGACGGFHYITMELIDGVSLARHLASGPLPLSEALRICTDVTHGLVAAHSAGVTHRDLKPDNILLAHPAPGASAGSERVVLTDFGIARADEKAGADERPESQRNLTVGAIVGTPAYMAPEQILGETPDGRTDVFALGVVLFEMLTGHLPFEGASAMQQATARLTRPAPDLCDHCANTPPPLAALLRTMLARDRRERPDARQVLDALVRLRGEGRAADPLAELAPVPSSTSPLSLVAPRIRSVAVLPLRSVDPALAVAGFELSSSLADSLARNASLRVVPPAFAPAEASPVADLLLAGSLRSEDNRLRVNLRYLDPSQKTQRWSERFEGQLGALFALEDTLLRAAEGALRSLTSGSEDTLPGGPKDPAVRALYDRAVALSHRMNDPEQLAEALSLARRAQAQAPGDAAVMSLLGLVLVRNGLAHREGDPGVLIAEAEDWALRALNADASAATFATLGLVRLHQGDHRASVRAFREALTLDPRQGEASAYLGRFLLESGYIEEGTRRLEFALKIEPSIQHAWWNLARSYALQRQWERSEEVFRKALAATGNQISLDIVRSRIAFWKQDPAFAQEVADSLDRTAAPGHFSRAIIPSLRAYAAGEPLTTRIEELRLAGSKVASPSLRAFWFQLEAEILGLMRRVDAALDAIDAAVSLPFIDVGWMDHCPALDSIRRTGRFGQARDIVAARAESLWR
jgi:serine/threonine-protein kinase